VPTPETRTAHATHRRFEDLLPELEEYLDVDHHVHVPVTAAPVAAPVVTAPVASPLLDQVLVDTTPVSAPTVAATSASPAGPAAVTKPSAAAMRRQVELAVAAADQLIDSIGHLAGVRSVSIKVKLTAADQSEVETEAEWHAAAPEPVSRRAPATKPARTTAPKRAAAATDPTNTTPPATRRRTTRGATT
jgi:hypothetical protein